MDRSYVAKPDEELPGLRCLEKVTVDISVYLNCPSRQGFKYVLLLKNIATKIIWEYVERLVAVMRYSTIFVTG